MSGVTKEWIVFGSWVFLFLMSIIAEVLWLIRSGWTTSGKATGFVVVTDMIGAIVGGGIDLVIFFVMFMIVMGPAGRGSEGGEGWLGPGAVALGLVPLVVLFLTKRVFLGAFSIRSGRSAWIFSLIATLVVFAITLIPPSALAYFL
ncbi:MAG TPA: hypothetical protein VGO43_12040 [Pyrinomonadaceae bacterium]|jgi:hypothetical protein|nr:hypothetical protein [Pyrinomonadaceae bacterium]